MTFPADDLLPFDPTTGDIVLQRAVTASALPSEEPPRGKVITNVSRSVIHHSPSGFEFGYGGSGPADLALNILNLFAPPGSDGLRPVRCYRETCSRTAWQLHQSFKWEFLAPLTESGGVLPGTLIRAWIAEQQPGIVTLYGLDAQEEGSKEEEREEPEVAE